MKLSRCSIAVIIVAALPAALSACRSNDATPAAGAVAGFPFTVQSCGRTVTFDKPAERVVTIGSDAHVAVAGAGGVDKIVARAGEFGVPPPEQIAEAIKDVPIIESSNPGTAVNMAAGSATVTPISTMSMPISRPTGTSSAPRRRPIRRWQTSANA